MPQAIQATPDELETRYETIAALIISDGLTQKEVVDKCLELHPEWGVQRRQVYNYYAHVWAEMSQAALGVDRQAYYYLSIRQIDVQLGKAMRDNNQKAFASLMNTRLKLMNLDNPQAKDWKEYALAAGVNADDFERKLVTMLSGEESADEFHTG